MKSLTIEVSSADTTPRKMTIRGAIDEFSDLNELAQLLGSSPEVADTLVLDLAGIDRINSVGVSKWIRAVRDAHAGWTVHWVNVSAVMAGQLTMIANFAGNATVQSFYAPYFCEACNVEHDVLLQTSELPPNGQAPEHRCPTCAGQLVFDDVAQGYFDALLALAP